MNSETKSSIERLRNLREKLCKSDTQWKKAFEVRDYVISGLESLQVLLDDNETSKDECSKELRKILKYFEDNNNV